MCKSTCKETEGVALLSHAHILPPTILSEHYIIHFSPLLPPQAGSQICKRVVSGLHKYGDERKISSANLPALLGSQI